jgi:SAM-dependent methyltransferase
MSLHASSATRRKSAAARLAALAVIPLLCLAPARAQEAARPQFDAETAKQESIYRSKGKKVPGGYVTTRGLAGYAELLPSGFEAALMQLGPADRWLDIGAGSGKAILEYYSAEYTHARDKKLARPGGNARAVALSIEDRRSDAWHRRAASLEGDSIRYLFGKRLREYSREELGTFQLITDVYGGFSYTDELSSFMENVLGFLALNGSFYGLLQSVRLEDGKDDPTTWYLTELVDEVGRDVKVCTWLKRITCVQVSCESKSTWDAPTELIHIRKVCDAVSVPALVRLQYEAGTPPGRRFQLKR